MASLYDKQAVRLAETVLSLDREKEGDIICKCEKQLASREKTDGFFWGGGGERERERERERKRERERERERE